jgi:hypothetical protein
MSRYFNANTGADQETQKEIEKLDMGWKFRQLPNAPASPPPLLTLRSLPLHRFPERPTGTDALVSSTVTDDRLYSTSLRLRARLSLLTECLFANNKSYGRASITWSDILQGS